MTETNSNLPVPASETKRDPGSILLAADDSALEVLIRECVRRLERSVTAAVAGDDDEARRKLDKFVFDCVIVDRSSEGAPNLGLVQRIRAARPDLPIVLLLNGPRVDTMAEALRIGVSDVIFTATLDPDLVGAVIERNVERHRRAREFEDLRRELDSRNRALEEKDRTLSSRVQELLEVQSQSLFRGYEMDRLHRLLAALRGMAGVLLEEPDRRLLCEKALDRVMAVAEAEFGLLYARGAGGSSLAAASGFSPDAVEWFRAQDPAELFPGGDVTVAREDGTPPAGGLVPAERTAAIRSRLVCPIGVKSEPAGTLVLASRTYERFSQDEIAVIRGCEDHLALALSLWVAESPGFEGRPA